MRCADDGTLWAYAQGDLGVDERAQLDVHLASCAHCRDAVSRIDTSRAFLRAAARDHPKVNWDAVEHAIAAAAASQVAARPRWRMRGAFAVLGAVSALGLVCLWARVSHRAEITVEAASGAGVIGSLAPDAPAKAVLQTGATLGSGASLVTAEGGSALLQLPDSSRARLGPLTRARFARVDRAEVEIHLGVGRLAVEAAHAGRRRFLVDAGSVRVTVVGTVFRVERDGDRVIVAVARGQVRVDADALPPRFLDAGRRLVTGAGGAALAEGALTAEDGEAFGHLGVIPIALDASRATTDPPAPPHPAPAARRRCLRGAESAFDTRLHSEIEIPPRAQTRSRAEPRHPGSCTQLHHPRSSGARGTVVRGPSIIFPRAQ